MNKHFNQMLVNFSVMLGRMEHAKLAFYSSRAIKQQEKNLKYLMKQGKNTEYGKKNNFKDVKSIEDYQNIVPYSWYPDYADYIERIAYKPLRKASSPLAVLITAIGVSYLLQNLGLLIFGADTKSFKSIVSF